MMSCHFFQEMSMSGGPFQNATPGHASALNTMAGHSVHNLYSHATGGPPFPNNSLVKSPYVGSTSVTSLTPVEVYRQQHEVTATVCVSASWVVVFVNVGMSIEFILSSM